MQLKYAEGFAPVYDRESAVLILGSFPSVKSRQVKFYYGNERNRFWGTVSAYFGAELPKSAEDKRSFALRYRIALWDIVTACEIDGSKDSSIANERLADVPALMKETKIERIFCNGKKAYELTLRAYPALAPFTELLPSTSPANPRFSAESWFRALDTVFRK